MKNNIARIITGLLLIALIATLSQQGLPNETQEPSIYWCDPDDAECLGLKSITLSRYDSIEYGGNSNKVFRRDVSFICLDSTGICDPKRLKCNRNQYLEKEIWDLTTPPFGTSFHDELRPYYINFFPTAHSDVIDDESIGPDFFDKTNEFPVNRRNYANRFFYKYFDQGLAVLYVRKYGDATAFYIPKWSEWHKHPTDQGILRSDSALIFYNNFLIPMSGTTILRYHVTAFVYYSIKNDCLDYVIAVHEDPLNLDLRIKFERQYHLGDGIRTPATVTELDYDFYYRVYDSRLEIIWLKDDHVVRRVKFTP